MKLFRRPSLVVAAFVFVVTAFLTPGVIDNIDTRITFRGVESLLDTGSLAIQDPRPLEREGLWTGIADDGRVYSKFGVGFSMMLVPFAALGRLLGNLTGIPPVEMSEFLVVLGTCLFLAWAAGLVYSSLTRRLGLSAGAAMLGVGAWCFGTFQLSYSGSAYRETHLGFLLVLLFWFLLEAAERPDRLRFFAGAGFAAGALVAVKTAMVAVVPFVLAPVFVLGGRERMARKILATSVPLGFVGAFLLWMNQVRFGSPFDSGYVAFDTLFETPVWFGLREYLLDPDLSLAIYAPASILALFGVPALWRRSRLAAWLVLASLIPTAVVHAMHTGYHGGTAYGPRYLVPAIALLAPCGVAALISATRGISRRAVPCLVLVCVLVNVPSVLVSPLEYHTIRGRLRDRGMSMDSLPPRVLTDVRLAGRKLADGAEPYDLPSLLRPGTTIVGPETMEVARRDRGPAIWWIQVLGERGAAGAVAGGLLALAIAGLGMGLRRIRDREDARAPLR